MSGLYSRAAASARELLYSDILDPATQAGRGKINVKRRVYREGNDAIRAIIDKALAKTRAVQHHQQQSPCASKRVLRPRSRPTTARRPMSSRQPRPLRQHDASSARDGVGRTSHATHGHAVRQQQQQQLQQLQQQHHHQAPVASADVRLRAVAKPPTLSPRSCRRGRTRDGGDGEQGDDGGGDGGDENGDTGGGGGDDSGGGSDDEDYADDDEDTEAQDTIQRQQQQQRRRQWRSSQRQAALVRPPPSLQYGQQDQLLSLRPTRSTMDRRQRLPDNRLPTTSQQLHARAILTSAYAPRLRPRRTSQPADSLRISGYGGKPASQTHTSTSSL
ncbi:hypothetical protein PTSG_10297 [Salpingoeca rosetta]|uniref:Uncharacterized protein n=1 Tax=Salpingoeca rosetta (strain ATCC 50818 / BSB-021) TaxID=946362 RepID=F2UQW7_SALR5|nr:uncharacterized protein PTSG_10297 [Salpingoeca rosetta]EGD80022.1 hypothetical protein PTSG_10297 [Salpingoeca rosetta]|eukprot:XP_004988347.1 hypothetical protein PTSG_10297 [Salpingoeca rosetta]